MGHWAKKKYIGRTVFAICVCVFMLACGREERQRGIDGHVYEAELLADTGDWGYHFKSDGNWLYYIDYGRNLFRVPLEGDLESPKAEKISGGEEVQDYAVDAEGGVYIYKAEERYRSGRAELTGGVLVKYGTDGKESFSISLEDHNAIYGSLSAEPGFLAAGGRNDVFLLSGDEILVVDGEMGKIRCSLDIASNRPEESFLGAEKLLEGGNGRVYYLVSDAVRQTVYEVAKTGESYRLQAMSGKGWDEKTSLAGKFYGSLWGMLYSGLDGVLWQYAPGEEKWSELLRWSDSNLWQNGQEIVWISESRLLTSFISHKNGGNDFYLLSKKSVDELPKKEELVLACHGHCPDELEDAVIFFNRGSDQYHVTVQVYEGEDAFVRLDAALVSSDPPDMLELSGLDMEKYGGKQALENLTEYMSGDSSLRREDFLEGVLDGYTVDGRLVGIPSAFVCHTLLAQTAEAGDEAGWTMDDMISLSREYPGRKLNGRSFYRNLDMICGSYIMNRFVDRKRGECDFDSDEFGRLIAWLAEHSGTGTDYYASEEVENPLIVCDEVGNILEFLRDVLRSEKGMTMIGYPSVDGRPLHHAWTYNAVGITSKSRNKEGAWGFIEYFLSLETGDFAYGIPTRRDLLDEMLEDAATPAYLSIDGEIQYDENGNPIEMAKWAGYSGGEPFSEDCATQEETDRFLEMLSHTDFSPDSGLKSQVMSIIAEEMTGYFNKDKSLEEVTGMIQNRVGVLLGEFL